MKHCGRAFIFASVAVAFLTARAISGYGQDSQTDVGIPIVVDGDEVHYLAGENLVVAEGNVRIEYEDVVITSDQARVNTLTRVAELDGNVVVTRGEEVLTGERVVYDLEARSARVTGVHLEAAPFYAYGESVEKISDEKYVLRDACVTTCGPLDEERHFLDYALHAKRIEFYPDRKIVARNVVLMIGSVPILYLPYYVQPVKDRLPRVQLIPGHDSDKGFFLLSAWRYYFNEGFRGRYHLDYYSEKGIGTGLTHSYDTRRLGDGVLDLYYIGDQDKVSFEENVHVGGDRYKVQLRHRWTNDKGTFATMQLNKFSDPYFMKDYFYQEYEQNTSPLSYLSVNHTFSNSALSILAQKRLNDFYERVEYLPRISWDTFRSRLGDSGFYYDSRHEFSNLARRFPDPSTDDREALRFDSRNTLSYQQKLAWLSLRPFAGTRQTYYSRGAAGEDDVTRGLFFTGIEASTRLYRMFEPDVDFWGVHIDALKHIVTPIVNYEYTHDPTVSADRLLQFDEIDSLSRSDQVKFTLENKLQAKALDKVWDFLYFAPAVSYALDQEGRGSHFSEASWRLEFRPADIFYFQQTGVADIDLVEKTTEVLTDVVFNTEPLQLSLGHRYVRKEDDMYVSSLNWKMAPGWEFINYLRYDRELKEFERQEYVLRKELNCWFMDLGVGLEDDNETTVWLIFTLKAFPEAAVSLHNTFRGAGRQQ
jgi:lipopolysaccharide assembly outer membrane protein LptD (OstA)